MTDYTTTVRAYNNIPFEYRLKKDGYYDIVGTTTGGHDVTGLTFLAYNGLNMSYYQGTDSLMTVTADSGSLSDGSILTGTFGCLAEVGGGSGSYINYTTLGSPTVDTATGIVSGFSTSDYLKLPQSFPANVQFKAIFNVTYMKNTANTDGQALFTQDSENKSFYVQHSSSKFGIWDGTNGFMSSTALVDGTKYWLGMDYDYSTKAFKFYLLVDDGTYNIDTLPDFSNWSEEVNATLTSDIFSSTLFRIGSNPKNSYIWRGDVDLKGCRIYINDEIWWSPLGGDKYIVKTIGYGNFTKVGNPTIDTATGIASGFSSGNYIVTNKTLDYTQPYQIYVKFTTPSSIDNYMPIIGTTVSKSLIPFYFSINSFSLNSYASSNGSSWDLWNNRTIKTLEANTTYSMMFEYTGSSYVWYELIDNTWVEISRVSNSTPVFDGGLIQIGCWNNSETFTGTIDLSETYINVGGSLYWSPLGEYLVTADGLLPNGVIDDGTAKTWNLFYDNGTYFLNTTSTMTGYIQVGSIAIPSHIV